VWDIARPGVAVSCIDTAKGSTKRRMDERSPGQRGLLSTLGVQPCGGRLVVAGSCSADNIGLYDVGCGGSGGGASVMQLPKVFEVTPLRSVLVVSPRSTSTELTNRTNNNICVVDHSPPTCLHPTCLPPQGGHGRSKLRPILRTRQVLVRHRAYCEIRGMLGHPPHGLLCGAYFLARGSIPTHALRHSGRLPCRGRRSSCARVLPLGCATRESVFVFLFLFFPFFLFFVFFFFVLREFPSGSP
jgi:hypothetical protein